MKLIPILLSTGLLFTAAAQNSTDTTKKTGTPTKVTKVPPQPVIPKDATPLPDGSFRYVDKDGKKWIYRQTPFGVSKSEERVIPPTVYKVTEDPTTTKDLGDSVQFTRPTPFGPKIWVTKKSELSAFEQGIWNRDQQKKTGSSDAAKSDDSAKQHDSAK